MPSPRSHPLLKRLMRGLLAASLSALACARSGWAFDMAGATHRVTRDEVNQGGDTLSGGGFLLNGSLGALDTVPLAGAFGAQSGLMNIFYYPQTILDVAASPLGNIDPGPNTARLNLTWTAPGAEVLLTRPAASYVIKSSTRPMTTQAQFEAASTFAPAPAPAAPGSPQSQILSGLLANTSYYAAVEAEDSGGNRGFLSLGASVTPAVTLTPVPYNVFVADVRSGLVEIRWDTGNPYAGLPVRYQAVISETPDFTLNPTTHTFFSSVTQATGTVFTGLTTGINYYMRVRSFNRLNIPSGWAVIPSTQTRVVPPTALAFTGVGVDRVTANWTANDDPARSTYHLHVDDNGDFEPVLAEMLGVPGTAAMVTQDGGYNGTASLDHNTTYYFQVRTVVGGVPSLWTPLGSTMTAVYPIDIASAEIHASSAALVWPDPQNFNNLPIRYRADASTTAAFSAPLAERLFVDSGLVPGATHASTFTALTPNTTYYFRVSALNGLNVPSAPDVLGPLATDPVAPDTAVFQSVGRTALEVRWAEGLIAPDNPTASTRYEIDLAADDPSFAVVTASTVTPPSAGNPKVFAFEGLLANTTYYARIRAKAHSGPANDSDYLVLGATVTQAADPQNLRFSNITQTSLRFEWDSDNGPTTVYKAQIDADADAGNGVLFSSSTFAKSADFGLLFGNVALSTNTLYHLHVQAVGNGSSAGSALVSAFTATLANDPALNPPSFVSVQTSSISVRWAANSNPPGTVYRVQAATGTDFVPVVSSSDTTALSAFLSGLANNTSYYFRAAALNQLGLESGFVQLGATATLAAPPLFAAFDTSTRSIAVSWTENGNPPDTRYEIRDVQPGGHTATLAGTAWTDVGLATNTLHVYEGRAVNRNGVPSAYVALGSTRTRAASPPAPAAPGGGTDTQASVIMTISSGTNPTAAPDRTQFAVQIVADSLPSDVSLAGFFLRPSSVGAKIVGGSLVPIYSTSTFTSLNDPVWGEFGDEWPSNGVIISTGLLSGARYQFAVYARNGDRGEILPGFSGIPTEPGPAVLTRTFSGVPLIYLGDVSATASRARDVWVNNTLIPFTAHGSYHFHYTFSEGGPASVEETDPGWSGINSPSPAPEHCPDTSCPGSGSANYTGDLAGFRAAGEGEYYLNILGDSFLPPTLVAHGDRLGGLSFRVKVDLQKPAVTSVAGQFDAADPTPITTPTPDQDPYFTWTTDNSQGLPAHRSPIAGYAYSFSPDPAVEPPTAAVDAGISLASPGVAIPGPLAYGTTYYFKVRARDEAGNWSDASAPFVYRAELDAEFPRALSVSYGGVSVAIPAAKAHMNVTVGLRPDIFVRFDEAMHGPRMTSGPGLRLFCVRDNLGEPREIPVSAGVSMAGESEVKITPDEDLLYGHLYEVRSTTSAVDRNFNPLRAPLRARFYTIMNPSVFNVMLSDDETVRVEFPVRAWGHDGFMGCAINGDPVRFPMSSPARLPSLIVDALASERGNNGAYAQPITIKEFNLYDAGGRRAEGRFSGGVAMTLSYPDADNDGYVDGTSPPVKESALHLSWLDEETKSWVRIPGSRVDPARNTVTARAPHFSVYGIIGAPALDLAAAYAFPVPFKPSLGHRQITFRHISSVAAIRIYTVSGELVRELREDDGDGELKWDVTNQNGEPLASDVYLYLIENNEQKKTGKLLIVR